MEFDLARDLVMTLEDHLGIAQILDFLLSWSGCQFQLVLVTSSEPTEHNFSNEGLRVEDQLQ